MAKFTITNTDSVPVRFFHGHCDVQIDVPAGATQAVEVPSGTVIIDMTPLSAATQKSLDEYQKNSQLYGGGDGG